MNNERRDVQIAKQLVKMRSKFHLLNSTAFLLYRKCDYFLKLCTCCRSKKYQKLKKKQDKAMEMIEDKLDIVKFIRQQIYLDQLLKVHYSKIERFFIKHPKKLVLDTASSSSSNFSSDKKLNIYDLDICRQEGNLKQIIKNTLKSKAERKYNRSYNSDPQLNGK